MTSDVAATELQARLSDYLKRVAEQGERIIVEEGGVPKAALVSLADLDQLAARVAPSTTDVAPTAGEAPTSPVDADDLASREAAFRRDLQEAGLVRHWREGPRQPLTPHEPLPVLDPPLSEQIIAERR